MMLTGVEYTPSLLAEVSHDAAKWNERREISAGFDELFNAAADQISGRNLPVFKNRFL